VYLLTNKPQSVPTLYFTIYMIILPNSNYVQFLKNISSFSYSPKIYSYLDLFLIVFEIPIVDFKNY